MLRSLSLAHDGSAMNQIRGIRIKYIIMYNISFPNHNALPNEAINFHSTFICTKYFRINLVHICKLQSIKSLL